MKTLNEIKDILQEQKQKLLRSYPIKSMAIFGSYSREDQNENSDLDILVEFDGKIGVKFIDLADELEKAVGFKVDLVSKNGIKPKYLNAIKQELKYV
ncbi:nucleotidyltransferase family protein [Marivirga tractuosa]|uniref:nucleotidyltransferase family protein n=1 Tax=Marivirga tractuosa TaxID=1006 RepID=UPI0035D1308C